MVLLRRLVAVSLLLLAASLAGCHERLGIPGDPLGSGLPAHLARGGWALQDDLNLSVDAEPLRFRSGEWVVVRHVVINEGDRSMMFDAGGCGVAWQVRLDDGKATPVTWREPSGVCDQEANETELVPAAEVRAEARWDGRDRSTDPPTDVAPGQYRFVVDFRYHQGDRSWRVVTADALVEVRPS